MASSLTNIAVTREASMALDLVSKRTGMSKKELASGVLLRFFDAAANPQLEQVLSEFAQHRRQLGVRLADRIVDQHRSEIIP
jgi:hypothetical protein